jgi:hypothetical protein
MEMKLNQRVRINRYLYLIVAVTLYAGCENMTNVDHTAPVYQQSTSEAAGVSSIESISYEAVVLERLAGRFNNDSWAQAINNNNVIAGAARNGDGSWTAVQWTVNGSGDIIGPVELGRVPEEYDGRPAAYDSDLNQSQIGRSVNSNGIIVGEAQIYQWDGATLSTTLTAFIYDGEMKKLPGLADDVLPRDVGDKYDYFAWEINDDGIAAGWAEFSVRDDQGEVTGTLIRGALWFPPYTDSPVLLDPLEDHTWAKARAISNDGTIAGWSVRETETGLEPVGVYWQIAGGSVSGPFETGADFRASAVNGSAAVAGYRFNDAVVWQDGSLKTLGILPGHARSQAYGISEVAEGSFRIVGWSGGSTSDSRAVIWSVADGSVIGPVDLGVPKGNYNGGWASDINDNGWVAGTSNPNNKAPVATIWKPVYDENNGDDDGGGDPPPVGDGPTASFTYNCSNSANCNFTDTSTGDDITSREWTTSDGQTESGTQTGFTFTQSGSHTVTLTVTDGSGQSDSASETISCRSHPRHGLRCS